METNSYKPGDKFLCKRYYNAKRIIFVPCEVVQSDSGGVTLLDLETDEKFKVSLQYLELKNATKPLTEKWVMNKVKKLQEEKTMIEAQIKNLFSIWAEI